MKKLYISTAIPYVNAPPHIGFALEIIQADVMARFYRSRKFDVYFLTGTDENSLANVRAALKEGIGVRELVDRNSKRFYELKTALNLSFDDFIRTTELRHIKGAQKLWLACKKDIYKKKYKGLYCVNCESFYQERELINGLCPDHKIKPEFIEEENYFFKLKNYQSQIKKLIETDQIKIIPESRKNEMLSFINMGLEDFCISRSKERAKGWGIEVPADSSQVMWVWFDALSNYINALGYGDNSEKFNDFWVKSKNKIHVIGKGIIRFHALYWPAMLLAAGINLPETILVHGYITKEGEKMSKTLRNIVDPFEIVKKYGTDPLRYYLLREIPATGDGDFSESRFQEIYKSDLINSLGNLVQRVLVLSNKNKIIALDPINKEIKDKINLAKKEIEKCISEFKFNEAVVALFKLVEFGNIYIDEKKPWSLSSNESIKVLSNLIYLIDKIKDILMIFLPETSKKISDMLNIKNKKIKIIIKEPLFKNIL